MSQKIPLTIEKLNSSGSGIARKDGLVYFVPLAVPGDEVTVQVEKQHKKYVEARLLIIQKKSPDRVDPPCPYFFECGGCQLQQMTYEAQLKWKKIIVTDALKKITRINEPPVKDVIGCSQKFNYRFRIQLHSNRQGKIGFYKKQSHQVVEIESCRIADKELNNQLKNLKMEAGSTIELRVDGREGFSQINPIQNEVLIKKVLELADVKKNENVFDLYCGSGNFTFPLSFKAQHIWGIERSPQKRGETPQNITWKETSVYRGLIELKKEKISCDVMLVDPPRQGLEDIVDLIVSFKPKKIIYVSCNPATFARDAMQFIKSSYQLNSCHPIDMFPQTVHVELVANFILKK